MALEQKSRRVTECPIIGSRKLIFVFVFLSLFFLNGPAANAEVELRSSSPGQALLSRSSILLPYGQVIFRYNEKSPKQVFIIGMSHRDTLTRGNASQTSRVQAEVYKIGEWLIHNEGVQLLLPEGFFKSKSTELKQANEKIKTGLEYKDACPAPADIKTIQDRLADDQIFINAEMLLKESHPLRLKQVEDWVLYESVCKSLLKLASSDKDSCDATLVPELDYLQQRRLAAMLQKIPEVIDEEFQHKDIKEQKAIFTIGMMHVHTIIKYLNDKKIMIRPPVTGSEKGKEHSAQLNLFKDNFGISIILPKTLADNQDLLKTHQLDKITAQTRSFRLD